MTTRSKLDKWTTSIEKHYTDNSGRILNYNILLLWIFSFLDGNKTVFFLFHIRLNIRLRCPCNTIYDVYVMTCVFFFYFDLNRSAILTQSSINNFFIIISQQMKQYIMIDRNVRVRQDKSNFKIVTYIPKTNTRWKINRTNRLGRNLKPGNM